MPEWLALKSKFSRPRLCVLLGSSQLLLAETELRAPKIQDPRLPDNKHPFTPTATYQFAAEESIATPIGA